MSIKAKVTDGKGFKYINDIIVHETDRQKIILTFKHVPDKKNQKLHHIDLQITKLKKNPSQAWEEAEKFKVVLTTDKPHRSLNKLINSIKGQPKLSQFYNQEAVILDSDEANIFAQIGKGDLSFVSAILTSFESSEAREQLLKISKEEIDSFYASVKHIKNKKSVDVLETLIDRDVKEHEFQKWIKENAWVFGSEYVRFHDIRKIGLHSEADFIVESLDGFTDLIELKRSTVQLFEHDAGRKLYYPSKHLSAVIGQGIHYMHVMEKNKNELREEDDLTVLKPRVKVVIGRSSQLGQKEKQALRLLNSELHAIEIITYDEILARAKKLIESYDRC